MFDYKSYLKPKNEHSLWLIINIPPLMTTNGMRRFQKVLNNEWKFLVFGSKSVQIDAGNKPF